MAMLTFERDVILRGVRRIYHFLHGGSIVELINDLNVRLSVPSIKRNYGKTLLRLKANAPDKIRIVFLVSDCCKWKVQSVYDKLSCDKRFDMVVAVSLYGWHEDIHAAEEKAHVTHAYFKNRGIPVEYAYSFERQAPIPLEKFQPDIVFYDQPWDVFPCHMPKIVSRRALTCYVDYGIPTFEVGTLHCALPFHRMLFCHYTISENWTRLAERVCAKYKMSGSMIPVGYPALDTYSGYCSDFKYGDDYVIYAPHWSFPHPDNPNNLNLSTFLWSGKAILDYANAHKEVRWVFKPHPVLENVLIKSGIMTKDEVHSYYEAWDKVGDCCYTGDYSELFKKSRVMITDSASFLTEYACTGCPLIHLINSEFPAQFCQLNKALFSTYYQVRSPEELEPMLDKIIIKREDPNRGARLAAAKAMNLTGVDAAGNIVAHLENLIWG